MVCNVCLHTKNCILWLQTNIYKFEELYVCMFYVVLVEACLPISQPASQLNVSIIVFAVPIRSSLHVLHSFLNCFCFVSFSFVNVFVYVWCCPYAYHSYSHSVLSRSLAVYYAVSVIADEQPYLSHSHSEFNFFVFSSALPSNINCLLSSVLFSPCSLHFNKYLLLLFFFRLRQCRV